MVTSAYQRHAPLAPEMAVFSLPYSLRFLLRMSTHDDGAPGRPHEGRSMEGHNIMVPGVGRETGSAMVDNNTRTIQSRKTCAASTMRVAGPVYIDVK